MPDVKKIVATNIKRLRAERGWTQAYLAELVDVDQATVQRWESGERWPQAANVQALAQAFAVPFAAFYQLEAADTLPPLRVAIAVVLRALKIDPAKPVVKTQGKKKR